MCDAPSLETSVTVVEWGEGKVEGLADNRLVVHIDRGQGTVVAVEDPSDTDEPRTVTLEGVGPRWSDAGLDDVLVGIEVVS